MRVPFFPSIIMQDFVLEGLIDLRAGSRQAYVMRTVHLPQMAGIAVALHAAGGGTTPSRSQVHSDFRVYFKHI
jgi:methyl coenzyme M reductase alpha subunit